MLSLKDFLPKVCHGLGIIPAPLFWLVTWLYLQSQQTIITAPGFSAYPALSILAARFQENRTSAEKLVSRVFPSNFSLKTINN